APATVTDGTSVAVPASATATSFTDTGLSAATQYSYSVFAKDGVPNYSAGVTASATTEAVPVDVTPPASVTGLAAASASDTSIALSWANPSDADFAGVTIRRALGATAPATVTDGTSVAVPASATTTSFTDTALTSSTTYSYAVFSHDGVPNHAAGVNVTAATSADVTAPGPVTGLNAAPTTIDANQVQVRLSWTSPADPDFAGVTIRRLHGATAPATRADGDLVVTDTAQTNYTNTTGLIAGTQYSYAVFAHDLAGNYAAPTTVTVTTALTPTAALLTINGSAGTAKTSANGFEPIFDVTGSHAGPGATIVSGSLSYGDGKTDHFVGDPAAWGPIHLYVAAGTMSVTLVVTDSLGVVSAPDVVTLTVYPPPVATIAPNSIPARPGVPVTFDLTWSTPLGTAFNSYDVTYGDGTPTDFVDGLPPATLTHTFSGAGTYTVTFDVFNDADGWVGTSTRLTFDVIAPGPVTALSASAIADTFIDLAWANPIDPDFTGVTIRRALGATAPATATDGTPVAVPASGIATSFTDTGLTAGTQYSYAVFAHDGALNHAVAVNLTVTTGTLPNVTVPGPVTVLTAVPTTTATAVQVRLSWANPAAADFTGVTIRRAAGATAPATVLEGDLVVTSTAKTDTFYIDEVGLAAATQYSYAVFAHDSVPNHSAAATVTVTTAVPPTAALLMINGSAGTAKTSANGFEPIFDVTGSHAGSGRTIVSGSLNYGDGMTQPFVGDPTTWRPFHLYLAAGTMTVTLAVTDSAGVSASDVVTVTVYPAPVATITATTGLPAAGQPVTFDLNLSTPLGTTFNGYDVTYGDGTPTEFVDGAPPATLSHIFSGAGPYTVIFEVFNDADGWVGTSTQLSALAGSSAP
ncbi:MAG: PKD domain-containing protein, partial [Actinomycetota bacterium]